MLAVQAGEQKITTVEGLSPADGSLSPLQEAFRETHALQCGFCTPGILCTVTELLRDVPRPDETQIRQCLSGNLCRCTGYQPIIEAVLLAASELEPGIKNEKSRG
ncbi:MAG: (2Fe-2S)-binding protein [Stellaceae bacterium]